MGVGISVAAVVAVAADVAVPVGAVVAVAAAWVGVGGAIVGGSTVAEAWASVPSLVTWLVVMVATVAVAACAMFALLGADTCNELMLEAALDSAV